MLLIVQSMKAIHHRCAGEEASQPTIQPGFPAMDMHDLDAVPAAQGRYFFGDYCSGRVWSLRVAGGRARNVRSEGFRVPSLSSFGEDAAGELYLTSLEGGVYKLSR